MIRFLRRLQDRGAAVTGGTPVLAAMSALFPPSTKAGELYRFFYVYA